MKLIIFTIIITNFRCLKCVWEYYINIYFRRPKSFSIIINFVYVYMQKQKCFADSVKGLFLVYFIYIDDCRKKLIIKLWSKACKDEKLTDCLISHMSYVYRLMTYK